MRASEEAVHQLQEEEQRLARSLEHQALQDEELAKRMVAEEKEKVIFQYRYIKLASRGMTRIRKIINKQILSLDDV